MREIVWLDSAVNDIVRLREFIVKENPDAAKRAAKKIKDAAKRLMDHPDIGKPVKDLELYRDLLVRFGASGYVIRYRVYSNTVYVVYIRHYREVDFKICSNDE